MRKFTMAKGIYVLFMECFRDVEVQVGKLGKIQLSEGIYAYVGSAYGSGGLNSRVSRHIKVNKKCRWHVDYIRRFTKMKSMWLYEGGREEEHSIADELSKVAVSIPMKGFGSSDCDCVTHLFKLQNVPNAIYDSIEVFDL